MASFPSKNSANAHDAADLQTEKRAINLHPLTERRRRYLTADLIGAIVPADCRPRFINLAPKIPI